MDKISTNIWSPHIVSGEQYCWQSYRAFLLLICAGIFSVDLQQNKQTVLIEYQSPFSFSSDCPLGILAEFAVLFVHFCFFRPAFHHFIIHHATRQDIKSFHRLCDKELHSFASEWCNFINIYQTVGRWVLIQAVIYDISIILLRSELCFLSGSCFSPLLSR